MNMTVLIVVELSDPKEFQPKVDYIRGLLAPVNASETHFNFNLNPDHAKLHDKPL